jgi:adenylate cyclase
VGARFDRRLLVGDPELHPAKVRRRARILTTAVIVLANTVGAATVLCFALFALPKPELGEDAAVLAVNLALALGYLGLALVVGVAWGLRRIEHGKHGIGAWLAEGRAPDARERLFVLRAPLRLMVVEAGLWGGAVIVFAVVNLVAFSGLLALGVSLTVLLGGITTSAACYLLSELALRPVAARALAAGSSSRRGVPGVATRWGLAWSLGTGVPIVGLLLIALVALSPVDIDEATLAVTILALGGIALVFGAIVSLLAAYATVHPISAIRRGLERVREGDLDTQVGVWDSTEMGLLQAGFNDMVQGLRERERIRDVFGRQVGADVARLAMADELRMGGELRDVSVLFVDLRRSTQLAMERGPEDVVALLNRFFAEVVHVVEANGGWINKFEGDAALAIFGAPLAVDDPAGQALTAARELDVRLRERLPELEAGVGVACGPAVAGNIGAETRFEYTVIGDPVNEASRLTDLAKTTPGRVLASEQVLEACKGDECERWERGDEVALRGRSRPTRLACPRQG